ncbi:hypothetical protein PYV61_20045, partial [Roseisolibacter sp. H3M3-2]
PRFAAPAATVLGAAAVDRLTAVTDRFEAAAAGRGVSSLELRVDNAAGGEDRIRVDVRGVTVDARIDVKDADAADRLAARVGDLRDALGRQGLTADALRAAASPRASETAQTHASDASRVTAAAGAGAAGDAGASGSSNNSQSQQQRDQHGRETQGRDAQQQHGSREERRRQDAERWLADEFTPPARGRAAR